MLRVQVEYYSLRRVILLHRVKQPQNPRMHQVIQLHLDRQVLAHPPRNGPHQRQMAHYDRIPLLAVQLATPRVLDCLHPLQTLLTDVRCPLDL